MEPEKDLATQCGEVRFEVSKLTGLLSLCEENGILPGLSQSDIDAIVLPFLTEPSELGFIIVRKRLNDMHRHLHELLYAPPRR